MQIFQVICNSFKVQKMDSSLLSSPESSAIQIYIRANVYQLSMQLEHLSCADFRTI
jgi:hypothetical protein